MKTRKIYLKAIALFVVFMTIVQSLAPLVVLAQDQAASLREVPADSQSSVITSEGVDASANTDGAAVISNPAVEASQTGADASLPSAQSDKKTSLTSAAAEPASAMAASTASGDAGLVTTQTVMSAPTKKLPEVDQNTGALKYNYSIVVPPGRNGMQPDLSLSYSSSNEDQGGLFGFGWSIDIPYIQRVNKSGLSAMYDTSSQKYFYSSIDGEIVNYSGSSYISRTENGNFNRYSFSNNQWLVIAKDGTQYKFGYEPASQQNDQNNPANVYKWMLQEIRDTNNNYITFSYYKNAGQIYPDSIKYTGNGVVDGIYEIIFLRGQRPGNIGVSYLTGFPVTSNYLINEIDIRANSNWVTKYVLNYGANSTNNRSLLNSIVTQSQAGDGTVTALPGQIFSYQNSSANWAQNSSSALPSSPQIYFNFYQSIPTNASLNFSSGNDRPQFVDLNGDGLSDAIYNNFICYTRSSDGALFCTVASGIYINQGTSWVQDTTWNLPAADFFSFTSQNMYYTSENLMNVQFVDLNGDGLPDFIESFIDRGLGQPTTLTSKVYLNNGHGWTNDAQWALPSVTMSTIKNNYKFKTNRIAFADINGDGLTDFIESAIGPSPANYNLRTSVLVFYVNNGHGWTKVDSLLEDIDYESGDFDLQFTDLNQDGLMDMLKLYASYIGNYRVFINNGSSWQEIPSFESGSVNNYYSPISYFADLNNDNYPDLLRKYGNLQIPSSFLAVYTNNGSGLDQNDLLAPLLPPIKTGDQLSFADINGDGLADVAAGVVSYPTGPISQSLSSVAAISTVAAFANTSQKQDLLSQITYPQGGSTVINYKTAAQYSGNKSPYPLFRHTA